jgi:acyl-CoA thioester hydrolase
VADQEPVVCMPLRVRYQECDGQGIVFNANYLAYVDMASFEVEKALFGSHADFLAHRVDVVVAEANLRYLAPCRFEGDLVVSAFVGHLGTTSLILDLLTELKAVFAQAVASLDVVVVSVLPWSWTKVPGGI